MSFQIAPPSGKGAFVLGGQDRVSSVVITVDKSVVSAFAVSKNLIKDCNELVGGGKNCPSGVTLDALQYVNRELEDLIKSACQSAEQSVLISLLVWWETNTKELQAWSIAWEYWYA